MRAAYTFTVCEHNVYVYSNGSQVSLTGCANYQEVKMLFLEEQEI